jgi:hypothetical protein
MVEKNERTFEFLFRLKKSSEFWLVKKSKKTCFDNKSEARENSKCVRVFQLSIEDFLFQFFKNHYFKQQLLLQSNSVITNSLGPAIFVRYNRVDLCTKMTNFT